MIRWERPDILAKYTRGINHDPLRACREEREGGLIREYWESARALLSDLPRLEDFTDPIEIDLTSPVVRIGREEDLSDHKRTIVRQAIESILPWRKGPFELFGVPIDAEWRSDLKWDRIASELDPLEGKRVVDIGCNNGYYMFRMIPHNPKLVIGVDPSERCWYQFELFQQYIRDPGLVYQMLGVEEMIHFTEVFDVVLLMGVLYHHRSPFEVLTWVKHCMRPGAQIIVENLAIPGDEEMALCPPDRYAKMRNVYLIPTASCLANWMIKSGFTQVEVFSSEKLLTHEQRKTPLAPYQSLEDFLDPDDHSKTVEGYPAPLRVCVKGRKKRV